MCLKQESKSNTGNNSPAVRPAWQRRVSTRHAWTAAARVKSEPNKKPLAPSQGSTGPARPGPGRQMAEARKRGETARRPPPAANQQCTGGALFDSEFGITPASPAPETRDCARVVHMRARWLMYVCVPPHGEGDRQHVVQPAVVGVLRCPGLANGCGRGLPHHHVCWTGGPSYTDRQPTPGQ